MASASKFITWSIRSVVIVRVLCINSCVERAKLLAAMSGNKIYNVYFIIVFQWPRHRSALLSFFYESFRVISSDEFSVSLAFTLIGVDHIMFKVEIMSNEDREWHESFSLVLGPDDPVEAVLGDTSTATVTILDQEAAGSLILPAQPVVSCPLQWMRFSTLQVQTQNSCTVSEKNIKSCNDAAGSEWVGRIACHAPPIRPRWMLLSCICTGRLLGWLWPCGRSDQERC